MPDQMPRTMKETVAAIWYTLHNGMTAKITETHALAQDTAARVQGIEKVIPTLWTREDHGKAHTEYVAGHDEKDKEIEDKRDRRRVSSRDWIMIAIVAVGVIAGPWIAHLLEKKP